MTRRLFLVLHLLCCVPAILSQFPGDEDLLEDLRLCATALNHSNSSDYLTLSQLSKSLCRGSEYYAGCMTYQNTVLMEADSISHTGAYSTIWVEISPNSTAGWDEFYYTFCVSYNDSTTFELVACASNEGEELELRHRWERNGVAQMRVGVFTNSYLRDPLGCNVTYTTVAGNFGLKIGMKLVDDQHAVSKAPPTLISSPVTNGTNNTYVTGNLTFVPKPELTMENSSKFEFYQYVYIYDYGDNSSKEEQSDFNSTHLYDRPGNYSYSVEGFAIDSRDHSKAFYGLHRGTITILEPVYNVSVRFNNNNSIIADTKVYLHICANGSFPISVCWAVRPVNSSNSSAPLTSRQSQCSSSQSTRGTCHTIFEDYPCPSYEMSFSNKGRYEMVVTFTNKVSCVSLTYTFHVVAAEKPPIVATTTSVGVVVAIVLAVVVVLIILAVGGYLPYRRYRNHMIETADFKFIDLSERKLSAWGRIKLKMLRAIQSRRNTDKIGLVNLIDEPRRAPGSGSSSTSSSSSLGSCSNYKTV